LEAAGQLARRIDNPYAIGGISLSGATVAYMEGRWKDCLSLSERAEIILRDSCTGVARERDTARGLALVSLFCLGQVAEISRRLPVLLKDAQERGDFYALTYLGTFFRPVARMAADEPELARRELDELMKRLPQQEFPVQHMDALYHQGEIDLYTGHGAAAHARAPLLLSTFATGRLMGVQHTRITAYHFTGRSALAAATSAKNPRPLLRAAERDANRLEREKTPTADALGQLIRAGVVAARGDSAGAVGLLKSAAARCDAADLALYAAAARRRLGELLGGDEGRNLVAQADVWMAGQQIRNPARMTAMLAPGFAQ
jgi:hypothetical protein